MSSDARRPGLRKLVAQFGVVIFITQMLVATFGPLLFSLIGELALPVYLYFQSGIFILLIAAVLPTNAQEERGCMWPLVGYDNAIDAIYTRGPWWVRFEELDVQEQQKRVAERMNELFGTT